MSAGSDNVGTSVLDTAVLRDVGATQSDLDARRWRAALEERLFGRTDSLPVLGRYSLGGVLGSGAYGVVYEAFDPELERMVALKLVRAGSTGRRDRLLQEARALARLQHPNVVAIHDVGREDDGVFIAMELVDGTTLDRWLQRAPALPAILDAFEQAGAGLAAAHAAGLVHRDFKPANVLVELDPEDPSAELGRVRVSDFGLARSGVTGATSDEETSSVASSVAGTPAYMAPEQRRGLLPDHRSDQFSFCVTLHEALFGERPSAGDPVRKPSLQHLRVPGWLRRLLRRGLSASAEHRFGSMNELLRALKRGRSSPRRRLGWSLGGAVAGIGIFAAWLLPEPIPPACRPDDAAAVWSDTTAKKAQEAFMATGLPYAESAFSRVDREARSRVQQWQSYAEEICHADDPELRAQSACLQWQLHELAAFGRVMAGADATTVEHAIAAATELPDPASCRGATWHAPLLERGHSEQRLEQVYAAIADAEARLDAGRLEDALRGASEAVQQAQQLGARGLEAEALLVRGQAAALLHGSQTANAIDPETSLYAAWLAAEASEHETVAAEALVELASWTVGQRRFDQHEHWAEQARLALEGLSGAERLQARLSWTLGTAEAFQGRLDAAYEHLERAEQLIADPQDPWMGRIHNTIGEVAYAHADYARAEAGYRNLLQLASEQYGSDHLWAASAHGNLGEVALARDDLQGATAHFERALHIREQVLGRDSYWVAHTKAHLGDVWLRVPDLDRARDYYQQVLDRPPQTADPATCDRQVWARHGLALVALDRGDPETAWTLAAPTLQAKPKPDPAHLDLCDRFDVHARVLLAQGKAQAALDHLAKFLPVVESAAGSEHRNLVPLLLAQADALEALERPDEALSARERARSIHARDPAWGQALFAR